MSGKAVGRAGLDSGSLSCSGSVVPSSSSVVSFIGKVGDSPFSMPLSLPSPSELVSDLHDSRLSSISDSMRDSFDSLASSLLKKEKNCT